MINISFITQLSKKKLFHLSIITIIISGKGDLVHRVIKEPDSGVLLIKELQYTNSINSFVYY